MKEVLTGNESAAVAAKLCRVQVCPEYEITPETVMSEKLAELIAKGEIKGIYIPVESEHSSAAAAVGACYVGARTIIGSSSHGTLLMHEMLHTASGMRLPIVFLNVNRAVGLPWNIWTDQVDSLSQRDTGWLQLYCENSQETLDTIIMAFKIAENREVLLPVMVVTEGFILSHTGEVVDVPDQELVDKFLPQFNPPYKLDLKKPRVFGSLISPEPYFKMKIDAQEAMERAKTVAKRVDEEFGKAFGRSYGLIEKFHWQDPKIVLVTSGTVTSTARHVLLNEKEFGEVGLLKIKMFRPFPVEEVVEALSGIEKVAVIDRNISLGHKGIFCAELESALSGLDKKPKIFGFIAGLGGVDVTPETIKEAIAYAKEHSSPEKKIVWLPQGIERGGELEARYQDIEIIKREEKDILYPGHSGCQGCGAMLGLKLVLKALGKNTFLIIPASCSGICTGVYPQTALGVPCCRVNFGVAAPTASGVKAGLDILGVKKNINVLCWAGDGATFDIGFGALSGAAEREDDMIYVCCDNEAYMNTGIQRSSATPFGAWTTTTPLPTPKPQIKKPIIEIMAAHRIPYAASASIAFPEDLARKIKKAKSIKGGLKFINLLCPCPPGWKVSSNLTVKIARLAVLTRVFPLYEVENGEKWTINIEPEFLPVEDYLKLQGRFSHLQKEDIAKIQENTDKEWERLKRFVGLFK